MMRFLRSLRQNTSGVAAVEFALLTTSLFFGFLAVLDFGYFLVGEQKLGQAVSAAALSSFQNKNAVTFSSIPTYVQQAADAPASVTVTTSCNGVAGACTNTSRTCACINSSGVYSAATCAATCSGTGMSANQLAGYYLTINASYNFPALIAPKSMLKNANVSRAITIRLQ